VTIEKIALQLGISQGTAYSLVHDILGFHKVAAKWVPRYLTEEHKRNHQHICSSLLERYNHEGDNFLNRIITGDETWNHHYDQKTNGRACNGSTRHLLLPKNSSLSPLLESFC